MNMKLVGAIVGVTIAIMMVGLVLTPIINDAVDDTKVYYNNTSGTFAEVNKNESLKITASFEIGTAGSGSMSINDGAPIIIPQGSRAIFISDNMVIAQNYQYGLALYEVSNDTVSNINLKSFELNVSNGVATVTGIDSIDGAVSRSVEVDWSFYRDPTGTWKIADYVGSGSDPITVYLNNLDQFYGANRINQTGEFFSFNGTDVTVKDGVTTENVTATVEVTEVMDGVISIQYTPDRTLGYHFTIDDNGEPYDVYPYFLVYPAEVFGQTDVDKQASNLLLAIPAMVLVAVIASIVAVIRRD